MRSGCVPPGRGASMRPVVWQLQQHLYERCYLGRGQEAAASPQALTDMTPALAAANPGADRWDVGWIIRRIDANGLTWVARQGKSRTVWGGEFLSTQVGMPPRVGADVSLFVAHQSTTMQPGFYFTFGDTLGDQLDEVAILRFYWNVSADEAPVILRSLADGLRRYTVPFRLKVLSAREFYPRPDALVLYVGDRYARLAGQVCADAHRATDAMAGRTVPLFTKKLADGLGAAEDPGNGESFGMSRCRVVAEGLWNAFVGGVSETDAVVTVVREHAKRYGLDPERPYLNPRSPDLLELADA